tara:strand:+ start:5254 stop:5685 length:432 start_codon:yes stop_codon:yes gene_type:complete
MSDDAKVTDVTDNIDASVDASVDATPAPEFYNVGFVFKQISMHYKREFDKINFIAPAQLVDGSVVEFTDGENADGKSVVLAVARIRFRNRCVVNGEGGDLFLVCQLSDLTFNRTVVPITTKPAASAESQPAESADSQPAASVD